MAIDFAELFGRLEKLAKNAKAIRDAARVLAPTAPTATTGLREFYNQFTSATTYSADMFAPVAKEDELGDSVTQRTLAAIRAAAQATVIETVHRDRPLPSKTLREAVIEMAVQMAEQTKSVKLNDCTTNASARSSNVGDGTVLLTNQTPLHLGRGQMLSAKQEAQFVRNETWAITCFEDAGGGVLSGTERFRCEMEQARPFNSRWWRAGSGNMPVPLQATCGAVWGSSVPGQNMARNGDMELWTTANTPDYWTIQAGSAGSTIVQQATPYLGTYAVSFVGNGSVNHELRQEFASTSGTPVRLKPDTVYKVWFRCRSNSGTISKTVSLGVVNAAGTSQAVSGATGATTSSIGTTYAVVEGDLITKQNIAFPSYLSLNHTGTALAGGENVYIDEIGIAEAVRPAAGSPGVVILGGATQFRFMDRFNVTVANDDAGVAPYWLDWMLDLYHQGLRLPAASSPSPSDWSL